MKKLFKLLGPAFRGLWKSTFVDPDGKLKDQSKWAVTFAYKQTMVETPNFDTPEKALQYAIDRLKQWQKIRIIDIEIIKGKRKLKPFKPIKK